MIAHYFILFSNAIKPKKPVEPEPEPKPKKPVEPRGTCYLGKSWAVNIKI